MTHHDLAAKRMIAEWMPRNAPRGSSCDVTETLRTRARRLTPSARPGRGRSHAARESARRHRVGGSCLGTTLGPPQRTLFRAARRDRVDNPQSVGDLGGGSDWGGRVDPLAHSARLLGCTHVEATSLAPSTSRSRSTTSGAVSRRDSSWAPRSASTEKIGRPHPSNTHPRQDHTPRR